MLPCAYSTNEACSNASPGKEGSMGREALPGAPPGTLSVLEPVCGDCWGAAWPSGIAPRTSKKRVAIVLRWDDITWDDHD